MQKKFTISLIIIALFAAAVSVTLAQSTTKSLDTNFTVVNLGTSDASVTADYRLTDGSTWTSENTSFSVTANGGQQIFRLYDTSQFTSISSGSGSVTLSADQQLGSVAQILARGTQTASSGAYSAIGEGASKVYVPLVSSNGSSADGTANSQIIIQNTSSSSTVDVTVTFFALSDGSQAHQETITGIPAGSSNYYDLQQEGNLSNGFYSAVVETTSTGGAVAVVTNFFLGSNSLQTFNGFPESSLSTSWVAPLVTSRLGNGLSAPITVQNLSGGTMNAGDISLACTGDAANTATPADFTIQNTSAVVNNGAYAFNPVSDTTNFPTGWFGSCKVTTSGNSVAFVQLRFVGTDNAAAYEALDGNGTQTEILIPLIAKRLGNGFATALTIQNLNDSAAATVDITYNATTGSDVSLTGQSISAGGSLINNHRVGTGVSGGVDAMADGFIGTALITSDQPIAAFVQLTNINSSTGDTFMAHNGFGR